MPKYAVLALATATALSGCAASPTRFYENRYSLSDTRLCRTNDKAAKHESQFHDDVQAELDRRGLTPDRCQQLKNEQNGAIAAAAVIATAVVIVARNNHGVGGGGYADGVYDTEWDWDQFYRGGQLVWECRGVQTGQFAPAVNCAGLPMTDWRWPGK